MRLFVGIPLTTEVIDELSTTLSRLRSLGDNLRWSSPETWHITLQFLGNTSADKYNCLAARLREVHSPPAPIALESLGFFDHAGIFFAGVRLTPGLQSLQHSVTVATHLCGFPTETRPYQPHITLARSKGKLRPQGLRELKTRLLHRQPQFTRFLADEFLLYESFLGPSGSRYEIRERFPLQTDSAKSQENAL